MSLPALMSAVSLPWTTVSLVSLACHWLANWHGGTGMAQGVADRSSGHGVHHGGHFDHPEPGRD
jgi:hypothetical protein